MKQRTDKALLHNGPKRVPEQDKDYGRLLAYMGEDRIIYWVPSQEYTGRHVDIEVETGH